MAFCCATSLVGCALVPDVRHKQQLVNPFPQIKTVAVLPFFNQSEQPTLSGNRVALAYMNELQSIRGFEVLPLGAVQNRMQQFGRPLASGDDFQALAQFLGVDVVMVGAITDYEPYYPPRMTMKVSWYAANPGFHPVLPGYGLPWGTKQEKKIPRWVHLESQRALATEQLKSQTPGVSSASDSSNLAAVDSAVDSEGSLALLTEDRQAVEQTLPDDQPLQPSWAELVELDEAGNPLAMAEGQLPANWPDPRGFIPDSPQAEPPILRAQHDPIISHMATFNGHDEDFTEQLADYFYFRDDARFGGWQGYLQRSEDFIRFCCHLHLAETLVARGGQDKSRLILRWPIDRYSR
ncbi:MAG: hypothetical protein KF752_14110 [Pirellulaceae bacterium]|nr:hypothetical protein [Pirellulaceae bacterium]